MTTHNILFACCCFLSLFVPLLRAEGNTTRGNLTSFHVGVVLDLDSPVGKVGWSCISIALDDFYATHMNYSTRLVLHQRDSQRDVVGAAFAALDLLRNVELNAIIGPQRSDQADFLIELGDKAQVPVISFSATSPLLSFRTPYFIRTAQNDSSQVQAITAIIKAFRWREVVLVYEDTEYGHGIIPYLIDALQAIQARAPYRSVISKSASDSQIHEELHRMKDLHNRVFIVHMSQSLGSRFFLKAKEAGMMRDGYAWIATDGIIDLLDFMDSSVTEGMQGVMGVRPYIPRTKELETFKIKWRKKFHQENPDLDRADVDVLGLWAYDTAWALAIAAEKVGVTSSVSKSMITINSTDFALVNTSQTGEKLITVLAKTRFKGLSGDFHLIDGQLQSSIYRIVNIIGKGERTVGFWTPVHGISRNLNLNNDSMYTTLMSSLKGIIWPGETTVVPKGWVIPTVGKKLRIAVPNTGFNDFVKVEHDPDTNTTFVKGYSIEIFKAVVGALPYALPYEFVPFEIHDDSATYDDMIHQVYLQKYDAVVGGTTITENRSLYVDFTLPYTDGGVSMIVPIKFEENKSAWIFLKPLHKDLWFSSLTFFIYTGIVVWALEHRINEAFRGEPSQHVGMILYFPFSTMVFAHRETVLNNLTRFVLIVWVFVVLIINSSYTASLSSMLTIERLQPAVTSVQELIMNGNYVGYQQGSFMKSFLKKMNFDESKLRAINSAEELDNALSKGSQNGGISAFFEVTPYIKIFISKYCNKYTVVGPVNKTDGFGFIFPRGSPLVGDVSRAVLNITEGQKIVEIDREWFGPQVSCSASGETATSGSLRFHNLRGLFIITGTVSGFALLVSLTLFIYRNRDILSNPTDTFWVRIKKMFKQFDKKEDNDRDSPV